MRSKEMQEKPGSEKMNHFDAGKNRQGRKKRRVRNVAFAWFLVLAAVVGVGAAGVKLFLAMGYRHLHDSAVFSAPQIPDMAGNEAAASSTGQSDVGSHRGDGQEDTSGTGSDTDLSGTTQEGTDSGQNNSPENSAAAGDKKKTAALKEGWVRRGDKVYEYIDDILTFLVLGIDIDGPVARSKDLVSGGQSDAIFLVVMNPDTKQISLIGVNRDTMVEIVMVGLGANGENLTTTAEISVQHGFGDGLNQSCELTRDAVSKLFYNLPIHGYISFNMGGMAALNDAVGSVRLTVLEDMTEINPAWYQGAEVTLTGKDAYEYVHYRNTAVFESARNRLARQKQYLSVFAATALAEIKNDITLPVSLYQTFKPYTVTDISVDEISWLASQIAGYKFDENAIYTMAGQTVMGQRFEEFYPDKDALQELILKVFYREIDPETGKPVSSR
ncbi:MAG: LCP family protein [Butyrivibrio sp.]|nr:LCP family protein [Acetatifactor muris]MCM1561552.1 LCP family protein [Butyrivibrio sp.]